jgi:hypothetical protein
MKTEPTITTKKLEMIKASIRCLVLGLLSLLPVIGVGYAVFALWYSFSARRKERAFWNPARPHRVIGLICASFGGLVWGGFDTVVIYRIINPY